MDIAQNILYIKKQIDEAELSRHTSSSRVTLIAVSKGHGVAEMIEAYQAGIRDFGESYLQEALIKLNALGTFPLCWHFIGPIQSNKARQIAQHFSWVHGLSRFKVAQQLNDYRPTAMPALNVCLQVNLDEEHSKTGLSLNSVAELATQLLPLSRLRLRGLMALPKQYLTSEQQYVSFLRLTDTLQKLNREFNLTLDTLSMGMSNDFQAAIRAGSTMVRIGSAIFGARSTKGAVNEH